MSLLIAGGRVFDLEGDVHQPPLRDILVEDGVITAVVPPDPSLRGGPGVEVLDASGLLVMPGFVNAHYHSFDVLVKGMLEDMPFDVWSLHSLPAYLGPRSKEELRMRTLVGAIDCLRHGITTVQDMMNLVPMDEETLDTILAAYDEIGLRVVFSASLRDAQAVDIAHFLPADLPEEVRRMVHNAPGDARAQLDFVARQLTRVRLPPRISWALSASGPQRSTRALLEGLSDLSRQHGLPLFTHVYETKAQALKARDIYAEQGGSMIRYLQEVGLLGPRTTIVHGVWLAPEEMGMLAASGTGLAHNPISNLKLKNGIAPMRRVIDAGVNVALGCDDCSCGDCQSIFQSMKMLCLLAGITDPNPTGVHAVQALKAATLGGAKAVGLEGRIGAVRPGMQADLTLLDLDDIVYQPLNSAARQVVYSEAGRGVRHVLVAGEPVLKDGRITRLDEAALRAELAGLMPRFRADMADLARRAAPAVPYLLEANAKLDSALLGFDRQRPI